MRKGLFSFSIIIISVILSGCEARTIPHAVDPAPNTEEKNIDNITQESHSAEEVDQAEETAVTDAEEKTDVDRIFMDFLLGKEKDCNDETFWGLEEEDFQEHGSYTLVDMNGDGQNELVVKNSWGWIPDIIEYKDGKIVYSNVDNMGSSGLTLINTNKQFVSGDTGHVGRDQYWVSELDENGNASVVLFFAKIYEEYDETKPVHYYKKEKPEEEDYLNENFDPIDESEFHSLENEYIREDTSLIWNLINSISNDDAALDTGEGNMTKDEAYEMAEQLDGDICAFEYADFDFNGESEAFFAIGDNSKDKRYPLDAIWFIDSSGSLRKVRDDFDRSADLSLYKNDKGYYIESAEAGKGFFYGDCGGGGSGWTTFVFGVKDGNPYELDISMNIEGFYRDDDGAFYTVSDDFGEDGHKYYITELNYDSESQQFSVGKMTDREYQPN